jgi:hypothetical protein
MRGNAVGDMGFTLEDLHCRVTETSEGYKDRRPLVKHALIESWSVRFQNRSRIRLPKVPSSRRIPTISYVWPLPSNNSRRRARANLSYPDPKADGFTHQLQYRPESKSPDHPIQSRNAAALPRRASMGIDTVLGERPENCVQNDQCARRDG